MRCIRRSHVTRLAMTGGNALPRRIFIAFFALLLPLLLTLTACSYDTKTSAQGKAPAPNSKVETVAPIPTAMDTFRALAPPEGLRFTPLFNAPAGSTEARLKRLEDAVQTIRNDVDTLVPTMVRMVAIEKDIKGLVAQLQTLSGENGQSMPAQPVTDAAPAQPLPPPAAQQQQPPQQQGVNKIPGEDVVKGTEPAKALPALAGPDTSSSLVTPEAALKGELPPESAASPNSKAPRTQPPALDAAPQQSLSPDERALTLPSDTQQRSPQRSGDLKIPGEDAARGTELARALPALASPAASSSLVTPEAASEGELPPEGAASQNSRMTANIPIDIKPSRHNGPGQVINLRISDKAGSTRLVLDMTAGPSTPMKMINGGRTLVIDLTDIAWGGQSIWESDKKKLIVGGRIEEGNLYVDLKQPATIEKRMLLPPAGNNKNYRLMIDLKGR